MFQLVQGIYVILFSIWERNGHGFGVFWASIVHLATWILNFYDIMVVNLLFECDILYLVYYILPASSAESVLWGNKSLYWATEKYIWNQDY